MALRFNGANSNLSHGDIAALDTPTAMTICFWLNYTTAAVNDVFIGKSSATNNGWQIRSIDDAANMSFWFGTGTQNRGRVVGGLTTGAWTHWGFRYEGGAAGNDTRCRIWKDGVEQSLSFAGTIPASVTDPGAESMYAGENRHTDQFAEFDMDKLFIWNAALTPAEIVQQRYMNRPIRTSSLVVWSPYAEPLLVVGIVDGQPDFSGNGHHGTDTVDGGPRVAAGPISVGFPSQCA